MTFDEVISHFVSFWRRLCHWRVDVKVHVHLRAYLLPIRRNKAIEVIA